MPVSRHGRRRGLDDFGLDAVVQAPVEGLQAEDLEQRIGADGATIQRIQHGRKPRTQIGGWANPCCRDHGDTFYEGVAKSGEPPISWARAYCRIF